MSGGDSGAVQRVDQASLLAFITQVFDAFIDEMQPKAVKDCLQTLKYSYEALLQIVVTNFSH